MTSPAMLDETIDVVDDSPVVETEAPVTESAPAGDRGDGRNDQGQWVAKDANEIAADQQAEAAAAETASETPAADSAGGAPQTATPAPEPTPFSVRALGTNYALDGAVLNADGSLVVTPDGVKQIHQLFGRAILLNKREGEIHQQRTELKAHKAAGEAELKVLADLWDRLKSAQTVEEFTENAAEAWLNRSVIDKERELAKQTALITVQQERPEVSRDEYFDAVDRELDESIADTLQQLRAAPWAKGLTDKDWQRFADSAQRVRRQFVQARPDGHFYDPSTVAGYIQEQATWILSERKNASTTARQAQDALKKNTAAGIAAVKAPPAIGASARPGSRPATPKAQAVTPRRHQTPDERAAARAAFDDWVMTGRE